MSDAIPSPTPPPGAVHELCERVVDYVRRSLGVALDYSLETLPVLDHYLASMPRDQPATSTLVAVTAGAYFGEVARRAVGGEWDATGEPEAWRVTLAGGIEFSPVAMAQAAILREETEDSAYEVPDPDRAAVEDALAARGAVPEDEYYSLSGRLEVFFLVADLLASRAATRS